MHGTKEFWLASLRTDGAAFRAAASSDALDVPVPSCPEWTVEDLVRHLGAVYQWVRSHVSRGVIHRPETRVVVTDVPHGDEALAWWDNQFHELVSLLDALDPEMPAYNWAPQAKKVAFWHRRMAHETAVHRWDAQFALGRGEPVEAKLAADGVSEVLDSWLPAGRRRGPVNRTGVVQLNAPDVDQHWFVRLRGEGIALLDTDTLLDADDPHARVLAQGTASDLVLALFGRVPFDVLDVSGDASLLESLRTG
jgi:uncharacterized protein (TIGR03083 family)